MVFHINPVTNNAQECAEFRNCKVTTLHARSRDSAFILWRAEEGFFQQHAKTGFHQVTDISMLKRMRERKLVEDEYVRSQWKALFKQIKFIATHEKGSQNKSWFRINKYSERTVVLLGQNTSAFEQIKQQWQVLALSPVVGRQGIHSILMDGSLLIPVGKPCPNCGMSQESVKKDDVLRYYEYGQTWRCWF